MTELLTVRQFTEVVPVSAVKVYREIKAGRLPAKRFGKKILIDYHAAIAALPDAVRNKQAQPGAVDAR